MVSWWRLCLSSTIFAHLILLNETYRLMLIGDSIDRYITVEWCNNMVQMGRPISRGQIAENLIKYPLHSNIGAYYCVSHDTNDSIWFLHIFGSNDTGPYRYTTDGKMTPDWFGLVEDHDLINTPARIKAGMELFCQLFPRYFPDRIFFNSVLWDLVLLRQTNNGTMISDGSYLQWFRRNLNQRLDDLINYTRVLSFRTGTKMPGIGLKTVLSNPLLNGSIAFNVASVELSVFQAFNREIVQTAIARNLSFFDFNRDSWSTVQWNYSRSSEIFRDDAHQNSRHSIRIADKLLGLSYSRYYYNPLRNDKATDASVTSHARQRSVRPSNSYTIASILSSASSPKASKVSSSSSSSSSSSNLVKSSTRCLSLMARFVTATDTFCKDPALDFFTIQHHLKDTVVDGLHHNSDSHVKENGNIFLISTSDNDNGNDDLQSKPFARHGPVTPYFLDKVGHGCGDICVMSKQNLDRLPLVSSIHPCMTTGPTKNITTKETHSRGSCLKLFNTTWGDLYLFRDDELVPVLPHTAIDLLRISNTTKVTMASTLLHAAVVAIWPSSKIYLYDIFKENIMYRVQGQREVFVTLGGKRRHVWNKKVFAARNWSIESIVTVRKQSYRDLELLPLGEPLTV